MKITCINIYLAKINGRSPVIVEAHTDEGITGLGEAALAYGSAAPAACVMIEELAQRFVIGRNPFEIEAIYADLYDHTFWARGGGPVIYAAISALEQTLWDIKARALGVPVYELLGGKVRDDVRVYANGWSFSADTPRDIALAAERAVAAGYDALKMYPLSEVDPSHPNGIFRHVSQRRYDREMRDHAVEMVRAVRDAVGPDVELMVDMSAELSADAIIQVGQALEEFDLMFLEEPVEPSNVAALRAVADKLNVSIAVGERLYSRYGFRDVIESQAAGILQPDIGNTGGLWEAKKIAAMAEAYSLRVAPHVCAGPVASAVALHLDASLTNFVIQELYPFRVPEHFALVDDPVEPRVKNGRVTLPSGPGYGVNLSSEAMAEHLYSQVEKA
ncbi:mandelate racemase/muconate lactonizing enzyme family protein [Celeribacter indicus]|uniref:Mandelate racemase/muconate lactonizing protein n=1 Tax=Celeribacter indicus TaxID=1208324 RepID=A0A0B5DWX4_9RHOB|nr:mandelate racemase/muconate lactonizing enzyme family protein [Celeribacter indicus]AJE47534.1 mandelate racemase/muconate lactonizing protein [Celeribacter indicus]SDW09479.1 galactonate dehydratase [Celeribacter indicus]